MQSILRKLFLLLFDHGFFLFVKTLLVFKLVGSRGSTDRGQKMVKSQRKNALSPVGDSELHEKFF